ncbi:hypothetical protein CLV63_12610 [Murinocardiopsis flavida]|uniref:Uncharacterized protein n=1 Tax=Murinocardiopsis flavida TaxID=645275 RepID=A0A2P8CWL7_9ACTN|nr:hypothetical protein [Murinocardiopsis flavida]PSK89374.1 hypothetical protein CLV63_12610 [Murinocardiopsis flavida]
MRPAWNDPDLKAGVRVRIALWLIDVVGEGATFTKADLRDAFPRVEQVDRRMRELREHGWVIHTNKEDPGLTLNTLLFAEAGEEVWRPGVTRRASALLTGKDRTAIMAADDFMCTVCGIAGGETYPDSRRGETAQLSVSSRRVELPGEGPEQQYVTECKRCRAGSSPDMTPTLAGVLAGIDDLAPAQREELTQWIKREHRQLRPVEQMWTEYRRLPAESRAAVAERLRSRP